MYVLISKNRKGTTRQDTDRPYGVSMTIQCSFRVNPAPFPYSYCSVLPSREYPAISLSPTAVCERLVYRRCRKRENGARVASMRLVALEVQVVSFIWIAASGPPLDCPVVPSGANLGLRWAPSTCENDGSHNVEMTSECKSNLELARIAFKTATHMRC